MTNSMLEYPVRTFKGFGVLVALASLLSACATLAPSERAPADLELPDAYTLYEPGAAAPDRWWESFGSEELTTLVAEGLQDNFSLQQACARLRQASALARQSRAARLPSASYSADASLSRTRSDIQGASPSWSDSATQTLNALGTLAGGGAGTVGVINAASLASAQSRLQALDTLLGGEDGIDRTTNSDTYTLGLTTNYEMDLWGRVRANVESSQLTLEATRQDVYDAMQSLSAQIVLTWLEMLQNRQSLEVVRRQVETNRDNQELLELRFLKGQGSALDIYQQRQAVAQAEAAMPSLEAALVTLEHELAVLLGKAPTIGIPLTDTAFPTPGAIPKRGLPADLLARRSDVRAAGLRLASADWDVTAARADRLPALNLTGALNFNGDSLGAVFDNWVARLAGSVTGPIFDAGRRKAEVDRTRAVVDERLAAYRETVYTAIKEVENALANESHQRDYIEALTKQYEAARDSQEEARVRYMKGLNDYLPVLSALTNAQSLERTLVAARYQLLNYRVQLHLALGGAWMAEEAAAVKEAS